ncbi:MAG: hypothetical protein GXP28_10355 [Planctomycetes bacterium]|nr:hypothetical protein [Planctomycetota bacterium]
MIFREFDSRSAKPQRLWFLALRRAAWMLLLMAVGVTAGCGGCETKQSTKQTSKEDIKKALDKKEKKPPLEIGPLLSQLGQTEPLGQEDSSEDLERGPRLLVKPGHWTPTVQRMKANYEDFVGRTTVGLYDEPNQPSVLRHTRYTYEATRPVVLAKGRAKRVTGEIFVPEHTTGKRIQATLINRESGSRIGSRSLSLLKMPSYQYFIVVLAKESSQYSFLKVTDTVRAPWEEEFEEVSSPYYRVVLADGTKSLPLSANALAWTSIAYLIWDEVDPTRMSAEQQEALVDWLHWGGRMLVNGPDSLDTLRGSFLEDYLPVDAAGSRSIAASDINSWSRVWSARSEGKPTVVLEPTRPWSGIRLKPREGSRELVGGAGLFYEGDVGRGSVVVSAFQLAEREFINWPGYDSFLNAALLRRPHRQFSEGAYGGPRVAWADYGSQRLDAHLVTGLRLFARDAASTANWQRVETSAANQFGVLDTTSTEKVDRPGGVAAWSEQSPVSLASRASLTEAAAVRVPGARFVLACLGVYLVVLVPLNWIVFRSLNRVEWAWIAAPVIALLGTWTLVRMVQLDIGFVRSQTEIALLELQGDYKRGLLTRYTGLYSSLSTTYEVAYEDPTTVALPFPAEDKNPLKVGDRSSAVVFEKQQATRLRGLTVSSASRRNVHSEQMFSLAGSLRLGTSSRNSKQVENLSGFHLRDVVVVQRRRVDGKLQTMGSWIGDLRNGSSAVLGLTLLDLADGKIPFSTERKQAVRSSFSNHLKLDSLLKLAFQFPGDNDPLQKHRETYRLVAVIDQVLPGSEVSPSASQIQGATVVLAHLKYAPAAEPQPDTNSRSDVIKEKKVN